jgi:hypothetical protein
MILSHFGVHIPLTHMKFSTALSLAASFVACTLLCSCDKDGSHGTGPVTETVSPIQIQAGVGSVFTYELIRYDSLDREESRDGGDITLTNKNASFAGRTGVHTFSVAGQDVWHFQVDAQENMWEYHPEITGTIRYPARWQRLPTSGAGRYESVVYDSALSTPNSHMKQSMIYEFVAREPYLLSGVTYNSSKVRVIIATDASLNGVPFSSKRDTMFYTYIPKLAINAGYIEVYPYNLGKTVNKLVEADIR